MTDIQKLLEQLIATGAAPDDLMKEMKRAALDPKKMEQIYRQLKNLAGPDIEPPLIIEDYYEEGDGARFEQRWKLDTPVPMPLPFEALDRKTQFFVLFGEWQRRETEGMMALTNGQVEKARSIFEECYARADQLDVNELRARSYEGLMRVAERTGDQKTAASWAKKAKETRGGN